MKHLSAVVPLLLLSACLLSAAEVAPPPAAQSSSAPSAAEWAPVQQALDNQAPDAQTRLTALLRTYPRWADGNKALARLLLDQDKPEEALAAAKRAATLAGDDTEILRIEVRALAALQRPAEVYALMDGAGGKDPKGWLSYEAGLAAVGFGDQPKAEGFLKGARLRGGGRPPVEFQFLDSRVAILAHDYARAETSLAGATAQQADFWDGWYELGRVRLVLAEQNDDPTVRGEWIRKANEAFAAVATGVPADANGHIGLGRCALEKAKLLSGQGLNDQAGGSLRDAVAHLNRAIGRRADLPEPYVLLGDALLRLERWDEAATALARAKELGAHDRSLVFNLAIALQQTGKTAEADALLKTITAASPAERATIGLGAYRSHNWLVAANLLAAAAPGLDDPAASAATWRIAGHAHAQLAAVRSGEERERELDAAAAAYLTAGDLGDFPARHFYGVSEAARSPERAYAAGWQLISWDKIGLEGWSLVLANYGAAKTGGGGIAGMAHHAPLHLLFWALLIAVPLLLFLNNLRKRHQERRRVRDQRADHEQDHGQDEAPRPAKAARSVAPGKAPPKAGGRAPTRPPVRPPSRPPAEPAEHPRPVRPTRPVQQKGDTEPIGLESIEEKAETETVVRPPANKPARPSARPEPRRPSSADQPAANPGEQTMTPTQSPDAGAAALERRRK